MGSVRRERLKLPPEANERTPFERFKDLASRLVRVPKAEIDKQAELYRVGRREQKKRS
jgi:hypothetical protein